MLSKELVFLKDLQYHPQMDHMLILTLRIYQDVINKDNHKGIKVFQNTLFIKSMKVPEALVNPNDMTRNS